MSAVSTAAAQRQLYRNKWGLWLFFFSESFLFTGLLVSRFYLWGNTRPNLDQILGLTVTSILLLSSFFVNRGEMLMRFGDRKGMMNNYLIAAFLGLLFLVGVIGFEWRGHILPTDGAYGAVLYGMTGMHALHVLSGIIFLLIVCNNARKGLYSPDGYWAVQASALWWHYVDLVWVFFYPALYLMGNIVP